MPLLCSRDSEANGALEIAIVVTTGDIAVDHAAFGRGGVNELSVANVDAGMGTSLTCISAGIIEEHQIARLEILYSLGHLVVEILIVFSYAVVCIYYDLASKENLL